jgi:hypothetical protein
MLQKGTPGMDKFGSVVDGMNMKLTWKQVTENQDPAP